MAPLTALKSGLDHAYAYCPHAGMAQQTRGSRSLPAAPGLLRRHEALVAAAICANLHGCVPKSSCAFALAKFSARAKQQCARAFSRFSGQFLCSGDQPRLDCDCRGAVCYAAIRASQDCVPASFAGPTGLGEGFKHGKREEPSTTATGVLWRKR